MKVYEMKIMSWESLEKKMEVSAWAWE